MKGWTVKGQTTVKPDNDIYESGGETRERKNEDNIRTEGDIIALSDGAGGTGLYASAWSEYLLRRLPIEPLADREAVETWIGSIWQAFYDAHLPLAEKDPFLLRKFDDEGSSATLCALWPQAEGKVAYCTYGDSGMFMYRAQGKLQPQPYLHDFATFSRNPFLLNWKDEVLRPNSLEVGHHTLAPGDCILLASDALSQMIYAYYLWESAPEQLHTVLQMENALALHAKSLESLPYGSFADFTALLFQSLESPESFRQQMETFYRAGHLHRDDYSLVVVEMESGKKSIAKSATVKGPKKLKSRLCRLRKFWNVGMSVYQRRLRYRK